MSALVAVPAAAHCRIERIAVVPLAAGGRPVIGVSINGTAEQMLVDTGAERSSVTPGAATVLGLRRDPTRRTRLTTVGGDELAANAVIDRLSIGNIHYPNLSLPIFQPGGVAANALIAGIVGTDLLSKFDLELDFPRQTLAFFRVTDCHAIRPPWAGQYQTLPASISRRRQLLITVALDGHSVTALFDTGSQGELVSLDAAEGVGLSEAQLAGDPGGTATSGDLHAFRVRRHKFESLAIGTEMFCHPLISVAEFDQDRIDMLVGADYMRRHRFFLSFATSALFIQDE